VSTRLGVLTLLRRLADERRLAIVLITHDLSSAAAIADRVLVLYAGRIVEAGATADVLRTPAHPYTRLLLSSAPRGERLSAAPASLAAAAAPSAPSAIDPAAARDAASGCAFAARCSHAQPRCHSTAPNELVVAPGHRARCHLYEEGAFDHVALS
ncbi:MAG TPA: oligopeptide/dipeptide ABC transporter ATP-binding protein, partial [Polyangia bacterium]|nr:oligopeptide/dipeptide ABC transporter ATP-binding protein [Polyangia bacterium]